MTQFWNLAKLLNLCLGVLIWEVEIMGGMTSGVWAMMTRAYCVQMLGNAGDILEALTDCEPLSTCCHHPFSQQLTREQHYCFKDPMVFLKLKWFPAGNHSVLYSCISCGTFPISFLLFQNL